MPNDINKLRRLMRTSHHLQKANPVILKGTPITQSQALKYAWWFEDFRNKLRNGKWRFSYFKKEGSIREAIGTLKPDLIPADKAPKSGLDPEALAHASSFCYYDITANGWRSFLTDLFIGFVEEVK